MYHRRNRGLHTCLSVMLQKWMTRIELAQLTWKDSILPLNYIHTIKQDAFTHFKIPNFAVNKIAVSVFMKTRRKEKPRLLQN